MIRIKTDKKNKNNYYSETNFDTWTSEEKKNPPANSLLIIKNIYCENCNKEFETSSKALKKRVEALKKYDELSGKILCGKCSTLLIHKTHLARENNAKAQKIAQNKPEQKKKNREGVLRSRENPEIKEKWLKAVRECSQREDYRKKQSEAMKKRWEDPIERDKFLNNSCFHTSCHGIFSSKISGNIRYESSYELMFLFQKDLDGVKVKRFDMPIEYKLNEKKHYYIPDFSLGEEIVEVKSHAILKKENRNELFEAKKEAMNNFLSNSEVYKKYTVLFDEDIKLVYARGYIYTWLLKDGFLTEVYGGKSLQRNLDYNDKNDYNNEKFKLAKEVYKKWKNMNL